MALYRLDDWLAEKFGQPRRKRGEYPQPRPPRQRIVTFTEAEAAAVLEAAPPSLRLALLLCCDCGLRSGEAVRIAPADYNAQRHTITFVQKGGNKRIATVTARVEQLFALAPDTGEPLTPYCSRLHSTGRKMSYPILAAAWRKLKKRLGIRPELRMHDLRRTLATNAYRATKDLILTQQLLGHQNLESTLRYIAPLDTPNLRPLLESLKIHTRKEQ